MILSFSSQTSLWYSKGFVYLITKSKNISPLNSRNFCAPVNLIKAIWLLLNQCIFKSGRLSSAGPEILASVSHCSANFQLILDCFIRNFKLKYEDCENIKADRVNTVLFNFHQIKLRTCFFLDSRYVNLHVALN